MYTHVGIVLVGRTLVGRLGTEPAGAPTHTCVCICKGLGGFPSGIIR